MTLQPKSTLSSQASRPRFIPVWLVILATLLAVSVLAERVKASAAASNNLSLIGQRPAPMQVVSAQPVILLLRFDRPVNHYSSLLCLISPSGEKRQIAARLTSEPDTLYAIVGRLRPGDYKLRWDAKSMNGVTLSGILPFSVGTT
jgi:methionine-rich copper-binding protein CopC